MPRSSKPSIHGLPNHQPPLLAPFEWRHTRSMLIPKLPFVSNSRILAPLARLSHTLILPLKDVAARYCPSSDRAIDHISPALLPSGQTSTLYSLQMEWLRKGKAAPTILVFSPHRPSSRTSQILTSPPKPTLAATCPFLLMAV